MSVRDIYKQRDGDFVFIRTDTLVERLRRIRALNGGVSASGMGRHIWDGCTIEDARTKKKRF